MNELKNITVLIRLALRCERFLMPIWIILFAVIAVGMGANYIRFFPDQSVLVDFVNEMTSNLVLVAFAGQLAGPTYGALMVWRVGDTLYILLGLMAILTIFRHTRNEEETGRQELLGAGVVGRFAPLTASLVVTCGACFLTGALTAIGSIGLGFEVTGSIAFGLGLMGAGWLFAAVAALTAQITENGRTDSMLAIIVLGLSYLIRFVADGTEQPWLQWFSPTGWSHLLEPFGNERWEILLLTAGTTVLLFALAYRLVARRDTGGGIIPLRPGPPHAPDLRNAFALAWRLQRGRLSGWTIGFAVMGLALGGMSSTLPEIIRQSTWGIEFLNRYSGSPDASIVDIFLELIIISMGMFVVFYPITATLLLRSEEVKGHAELLLSTPTNRTQWMLSHLFFLLTGTLIILFACGFTLGLTYGIASGNPVSGLLRILSGTLLYTPAAWVIGACTIFLFGVLPRLVVILTWALALYVQLIGEVFGPVFLGPLYNYTIMNGLQPFHWVPKVTSGGTFSATPLMIMVGLSLLLIVAGLIAFRYRDIHE